LVLLPASAKRFRGIEVVAAMVPPDGLFGIAPVQFELVEPAKPRWRKL
jgi:hypothetical protein